MYKYKCDTKLSIYKSPARTSQNFQYNSTTNSINFKKQQSLKSKQKQIFPENISNKYSGKVTISDTNFDKVLDDYLDKYQKMAQKSNPVKTQKIDEDDVGLINFNDYEMKKQKMKIIFDNFLDFPENEYNTKLLENISDDYDGFFILKSESNSKDYEKRLNYVKSFKKDSDFNEDCYENESDELDEILNKNKDKISEHSNENDIENENRSNDYVKNNEIEKKKEKKNESEKENNKLGDKEEEMKKEETKRTESKK